MRKTISIPALFILLLLAGCDLPQDPGPLPQDIIATEYEPALNIMGILRNDGLPGGSFVHVQRTMTTDEIYSMDADPTVADAQVRISTTLDNADSNWTFPADSDEVFLGFYQDSSFAVQSGLDYDLEIQAADFPLLQASTQVPARPEVVSGSLTRTSGHVGFTLVRRPDAASYRFHILFPDDVLEFELAGGVADTLDLDLSWNPVLYETAQGLQITAQDANLTTYGSSSLSILPNSFHEDASTVQGGYGCFGSVGIRSYAFD